MVPLIATSCLLKDNMPGLARNVGSCHGGLPLTTTGFSLLGRAGESLACFTSLWRMIFFLA